MSDRIQIYDTTLRRGAQHGWPSLTCDDKLRIAQRLDDLGVAYIEGGQPGSDPVDKEFFQRVGELSLRHARIVAMGPTRHVAHSPNVDPNLRALLDAETATCTVVGSSWSRHVMGTHPQAGEQNLVQIEQSVEHLKAAGREVLFDAEHFFDGYRDNPEYAVLSLQAATRGGADKLILCDTNGYSLPWEVAKCVHEVRMRIPEVHLGIHTHNNGDCAVANTLAAVGQGVVHVQGTLNGYRDWQGFADLRNIIPDLELRMGYSCLPGGHLATLLDVSRDVTELVIQAPDVQRSYAARSSYG